MISTTEELATADGPMGVHVVRPDGDGPFPVVVYFHHGPGLDDGSKESMARIADWGHYVISHDRYHRERAWINPTNITEDEQARFWDFLLGTTDDMVERDLQAVMAHVDDDLAAATDGPMGCIGFCIGGRSILRTLQHHNDRFRAGVGFHPSFTVTEDDDSPHLAVPGIEGSIYLGYGTEDTMQPAAAQQALIDLVQARPDGEVEIHEGADHGYSVPGPRYHETAADRSYAKAEAVFARELG